MDALRKASAFETGKADLGAWRARQKGKKTSTTILDKVCYVLQNLHYTNGLHRATAKAYKPEIPQSSDRYVQKKPSIQGNSQRKQKENVERMKRLAFAAMNDNNLYQLLPRTEKCAAILELHIIYNEFYRECLYSANIISTAAHPMSFYVANTMANLGLRHQQHAGRHWCPNGGSVPNSTTVQPASNATSITATPTTGVNSRKRKTTCDTGSLPTKKQKRTSIEDEESDVDEFADEQKQQSPKVKQEIEDDDFYSANDMVIILNCVL